ncbi:beta-N-acetylhexosaminidase [Pedobacter caeni]|uniref:beta-N-acetylhexosaminidase n=1 Tax=Pedobacter caeni TaxID=288992 RepID=A0A1M4TVU3_9SPHI|nr:beta-N-acetylhexosaminidase [Pedobacter caeni]SHE48560.1 hexosaminidase [Pedobacter caeni]
MIERILKTTLTLLLMLAVIQTYSCKKAAATAAEEPKPALAGSHAIIPLPQSVAYAEEVFVLDNEVKIVADGQYATAVNLLNKDLSQLAGISLIVSASASGKAIVLKEDPGLSPASYEIAINKDKISITGRNKESVFHGIQTLRQYLWTASQDKAGRKITLKAVVIKDKPSYEWRVFNLDVARNFYTKDYVKKLIDWMALYKLNRLHLHLTDDQGWRIPIPKYPGLITEGSSRPFNEYDLENIERAKSNPIYTIDNRFVSTSNGQKVYKAAYTRADLEEIVAYAASNYVEVIPEVDMPGHMYAAIKAYPWLSSVNAAGWGKEFSWPICPCKPDVMQFAYDVLDELMAIFPSKYIHIGNDEVDKTTWESSPECAQYMRSNNLSNVGQIQKLLITNLQNYLQSKGRKAMVWDDATEVGVNPDVPVTYWRDWITPNRALANGNRFIMTPWTWFYLSSTPSDEAISTLYNFSPAQRFGNLFDDRIDGYQACVFTENIPSEAAFEYYVYPRLQAFAELVWANNRREMNSFVQRLKTHLKTMDKEGVRYKVPGFTK